MKQSIIIAAVVACVSMAQADPTVEIRYTGTITAGATATNTIANIPRNTAQRPERGYIGNIMLRYPVAASNVVNVKIQQSSGEIVQPYSVTFASSKNVAGAPAGTVVCLVGEKLIVDNSAGTTNLYYSIDLLKGSK